MSDSYITIVPTNVTRKQVDEISRRTIHWLNEEEIISKNQTDCVLGQDLGYPPGPNYKKIIDGNDFGLLALKTNGLEVITTRHVFDNGGNGLEEIKCPACNANNIDAGWGEAIDAWYNRQPDNLTCIHCQKESPITDYTFYPSWGFGEFGLTFWNWPCLRSEFIDDLKTIFNGEVKVIYGKR